MLPIYRPLHLCTWPLEGFNVFPPQQLWRVSMVHYLLLQVEDSKGISAVIQWRETCCSREIQVGPKLLWLNLCRSPSLYIIKKRILNCLAVVCTGNQLQNRSLNVHFTSHSLFKWRWEVVRGARRELGMVHDWFCRAAVSHAVWHQTVSSGSSVIFSCSTEKKLTKLALLIITSLANCGKQERSGTSLSQNFWRLGVCTRELFMCWPHFYILQ